MDTFDAAVLVKAINDDEGQMSMTKCIALAQKWWTKSFSDTALRIVLAPLIADINTEYAGWYDGKVGITSA